jgi:hypothetical protein
MQAKVFSNFKLHAINLGEKTARGRMIVCRLGVRSAQLSDLLLEPSDSVLGGL